MENKEYEPIIMPEEESPDDGFVPYCGSAEAEAEEKHRPRLYFIILTVLGILAVGGFLFLLIGRSFNYYHSAINSLQFDYRGGEESTPSDALQKGACAEAVSRSIGDYPVTADMVMYLLNEDAAVSDGISGYHYVHSRVTDDLSVRSGSKSWPFTKKAHIVLPLKNGNPPVMDDYNKPLLFELMFGSKTHDAYQFESYDAYYSNVNGKQYICEIWLLADFTMETPSYYTLYRYYENEKLAGLRVLNDRDAMMEVYDIREYTIG
ncbi:MAG: hypothetical protein IKQ91_04085 [Oscillospiraceae bacterium]|nr:hypothetical protein [Oscillospiraceae bacterium]